MDNNSTKDSIKGWTVIISFIILIWGAPQTCNYLNKDAVTSLTKENKLPIIEDDQVKAKTILEKNEGTQ